MLKEILKEIKPSEKEKSIIKKQINQVITKIKIPNTKVIIGGSLAKDTWLKNTHDTDLFIAFNYNKYKNKDISKTVYVNVNILDEPFVIIKQLEYPLNVSYEDNYEISFILTKNSTSIPKELSVKFFHTFLPKEWEINELDNDKKFVINLRGKDLSTGKNNFKITVDFKDDNKRNYKTEENFYIILNKPTLTQRIIIFFNDTFDFLQLHLEPLIISEARNFK